MSDLTCFRIPENEISEEFLRTTDGPGGQHRNRTENGVRIRWNFTISSLLGESQRNRIRRNAVSFVVHNELVVTAHSGRSLKRNRELARTKLLEIVRSSLPEPKKRHPTHPTRASKEKRLREKARRSRIKTLRHGGNEQE